MACCRNPAGSWRRCRRGPLRQLWCAAKALVRTLDAALHAALPRIAPWYWIACHVTWWFFHRS